MLVVIKRKTTTQLGKVVEFKKQLRVTIECEKPFYETAHCDDTEFRKSLFVTEHKDGIWYEEFKVPHFFEKGQLYKGIKKQKDVLVTGLGKSYVKDKDKPEFNLNMNCEEYNEQFQKSTHHQRVYFKFIKKEEQQ